MIDAAPLDLPAMLGTRKALVATRKALKAVGVLLLDKTSEWEVIRFRCVLGVGIVYAKASGAMTANKAAEAALAHVAAGRASMIGPKPKKARRGRSTPAHAIPRPEVTIFADASRCGHTGAAGWGGWMVGGGLESSVAGGSFRERQANSTQAEAGALANAMHAAKSRGYLRPGMVVMLQSDCAAVLSAIIRRLPSTIDAPMPTLEEGVPCPPPKRPPHPKVARMLEAIATLATGLNLRLIVRHVRGHQTAPQGGKLSGRAWVNGEVDRLARDGMRAARAALKATAPQSASRKETEPCPS